MAASRKFVCDGCQSYQYAEAAPFCRKCNKTMRDPLAQPTGKIERPHDDYTKYGDLFSVDPLSQDRFEKFMRRFFTNEAGLAGYAEV